MSEGETGDAEPDAEEGAVSDAFVRENRTHVRSLSEALLAMENGGEADGERVDEAFRAAHSLKANCQVAGLDGAATVAHAVEDLLEAVRAGRLRLEEAEVDEALGAVEVVGAAIDRARGGRPGIDPGDRVARLRAALDRADDAATAADTAGDTAGDAATDTTGNGAADTDGSTAEAFDDDLDPEVREALAAASDYDDLDALVAAMDDDAEEFSGLEGGGAFDTVVEEDPPSPPAGDPDGDSPDDGTRAGAATDEPPAGPRNGTTELDGTFDGTGGPFEGAAVDLVPRTVAAPGAVREDEDGIRVPGAGAAVDAAPTIADSSLDADRFGVTGREVPPIRGESPGSVAEALAPVRSLTVERRRLVAVLDELGVEDARVRDGLASLREATEGLGESAAVGGLRPVEDIVPELERAVEFAARQTETAVRLRTATTPVALARPTVERLVDPLVHLVRNAVDHGIEPPGERGAAGKPRQGTVTVRARREGGDLVVSVADDGRGIDPDELRQAAVERGVVADGDRLSDAEARDLLFEAGITTADEASEVSGRGVGMDVVAHVAEALDGEVSVESTLGEGTTVRLRVPVSIAVLGVTFVAVRHETYGVPSAAVRSVVPVDDATDLGDGRVRVPVDEDGGAGGAFGATRECPVVDLDDALSVPSVPPSDYGVGTGATDAVPDPDGGPAYLVVDPAPTRPEAGSVAAELDDDDGGPGAGDEGPPELLALRCDGVLDAYETLVTPIRGTVGEVPGLDAVAVRDAGQAVVLLDPSGLPERG